MGGRFCTSCLICLLVMLGGCGPPKVPEPSADPDIAPAGIEQEAYSNTDAAGQACMILQSLTCPEGDPPGMDCAESVRELVQIGTFERKNLLCIRTSRSVKAVRRCDVDCPQ